MKERVMIFEEGRIHWYDPNDIYYLQGNGSYTLITLSNGRSIKVSRNMKYVKSQMLGKCTQFFSVHKSWIINLNIIDYMYFYESKNWKLHLQNGFEIPVSRNIYQKLLFLHKPAPKSKSIQRKKSIN